MDRQQRGKEAEAQALTFLVHQGLTLIDRNYRLRGGEIDLILREQQTLVFVEVRLRQNRSFGGAAASVDQRKQQKIIKTAEHFLMTHPDYQQLDCRFDVIAFELSPERHPPLWYKDAFRV